MNSGKKIMIIEDDLVLSETIFDILRQKGYQCMDCNDSEAALQIVHDFQPDLILVDYLLPSWNGGELCGIIKRAPGHAHIPVIIMSAYSNVLLSLGDYGCDAILEKPFSLSDMENLINRFLNPDSSAATLLDKFGKLFITRPRK